MVSPPDWVEQFVFFMGVCDQNSIRGRSLKVLKGAPSSSYLTTQPKPMLTAPALSPCSHQAPAPAGLHPQPQPCSLSPCPSPSPSPCSQPQPMLPAPAPAPAPAPTKPQAQPQPDPSPNHAASAHAPAPAPPSPSPSKRGWNFYTVCDRKSGSGSGRSGYFFHSRFRSGQILTGSTG